ncbi:MAG: protein kinase [Gemmatimonadota bacterium]
MPEILERLRSALRETYAVEQQVGEGGMATVFLAEDLKHHRKVAIKVLRPELSATLGAERFLREIEMAARLQHPHIVPVYDSGAADGLLYYVMPYVEGESLRDLLKRSGPVPLARAAVIVAEAASGLAYAHAQGIVHRDVKPENIMLSGGHAVVTDFGIARAVDASRSDGNLTGSGMAIGTPAYMSPEQATADVVDARSDQYALACVFYEMVTGKQAFSGSTMQAMLTSMLTGPRPKLSTVMRETPVAVDLATQRALDTDPSKRFPSILAFSEAVAQESTGAAAATRESRRWKRVAILLPGAMAVLVAVWFIFAKPSQVVPGAESIAVVPFTTSGAAASGLGEGMVDLMASNLDGVGGIQTIEPRTVIREWRHRVKDSDGDREDAIAVARSVKAASVLTGSVVATGNRARLTAELFDLQGKSLARAQLDGSADSILALADGLALGVLRDIWRSKEPLPSANTSGIVSSSMAAIRAYLQGERYHRRGQWDSAQVAFEEAVAADSTFALAWYKLANTLGWSGSYLSTAAQRASANAVKYSGALSPRLRTIFAASSLFQQGDPSAADSMRVYLQKFPNDADAWYLLGESQYHSNGYRPMPPEALREPFDRVLALDSSLTPAAIHPMELALGQRDTVAIRRYTAVFRAADATAELAQVDAARDVMNGDRSGFARIVQGPVSGSGLGRAALNAVIRDPHSNGDSLALFGRAVAAVPVTGGLKLQFVSLRALLDESIGRVDSSGAAPVIDSLRKAGEMQSASTISLTPFYAGFADSGMMRRVEENLARAPSNMYVNFIRAMAALDVGQVPRAATLIQQGLASGGDTIPRWLRGAYVALDGLRLVASGDTTRGISKADSGLRIAGGMQISGFTTPVQLRYALLLAGRPASRRDGIERLRYGFEQAPEVLPISMYYLGKAYEADGQLAEAAASYGQFVRLWNHPAPQLSALQREAKDALVRLTAEGVKSEN